MTINDLRNALNSPEFLTNGEVLNEWGDPLTRIELVDNEGQSLELKLIFVTPIEDVARIAGLPLD